jgi:hypothetical protein
VVRSQAGTHPSRAAFWVRMLDLVDLLLLRRGIPADDRMLAFRRVDGNPGSRVVYFLPWHTPFAFARRLGFAPLDFLACYEMPEAIVSSEPELCLRAMHDLVADAERVLLAHCVAGKDAVIVGLSIGSYPATYLANRLGARLFSVASAHRADLAIWQSPATSIIKQRARRKGYLFSDYSKALTGTHPVQNLTGIAANSVFVIGQRDPFVPTCCKEGLLRAIATHIPGASVIRLAAGHFRTLMMSGRHQRRMLLGEPSARPRRVLTPLKLGGDVGLGMKSGDWPNPASGAANSRA